MFSTGKSLKRATYKHPLYTEEVHRFFHAGHVTDDKGTGLVHCAPAHGREDYIVAVENKLKLVCRMFHLLCKSELIDQSMSLISNFTLGFSC